MGILDEAIHRVADEATQAAGSTASAAFDAVGDQQG
jgi:hypothetical protein